MWWPHKYHHNLIVLPAPRVLDTYDVHNGHNFCFHREKNAAKLLPFPEHAPILRHPPENCQTCMNHRTAGVGRDLWTLSSATPWLRQGQLGEVIQDYVHSGFEYHHRWRLHSLSGTPAPLFDHTHSKEVFSCVQMQFPVFGLFACLFFNLCPLLLLLSVGTTNKSLAPASSFSSIRNLYISPLSFLLSRLSSLGCLSLSSYEKSSSPLRRGGGRRTTSHY